MIRRFCCLVSIVLTGCAAGSQFLYVEPNPESPRLGQGYVDLFVATPTIDCVWQVTRSEAARALLGGGYTKNTRIDSHAYLAEMATPEARLVRAETEPGVQSFSISSSARVGKSDASCSGGDVTVTVREGVIMPVRLGFGERGGKAVVLDPIPYRKKEQMLYYAAPGADFETRMIELAIQVDPNSTRIDGSTALTRAARDGRIEHMKLLLAAHAKPDLPQAEGNTALLVALAGKHPDAAQMLIDTGANPDLANSKGETPLARAVTLNLVGSVGSLIKAGAKVDSPSNGPSLLSIALKNYSPDVALALLNAGAPIDAAKPNELPVLVTASQQGYVAVVQTMLERHPELASNTPAWNQSLGVAIDGGKADVVRVLLNANPSLAQRPADAPLVRAAAKGDVTIISLLLARKLDVAAISWIGLTPLMAASAAGHTEAAKLLIDAGSPINARGSDGSTGLMWAAFSGKAEAVRELLARRADANVRSANGMTALGIAQSRNNVPIIALLQPVTSAAFASMPEIAGPSPTMRNAAPGSNVNRVSMKALEDGTVQIITPVIGSDSVQHTGDFKIKSPIDMTGFTAHLRGPLVSGTLYAADAGGNVLTVTPGMTFEQVLQDARARNVYVTREAFNGFRVGTYIFYFADGKLSEVGYMP